MTISFDFSSDVIPIIIKEIQSAQVYIRIAIFQLHNKEVISALNEKLPKVKVEIFTLPYDSINPEIREEIETELRQLQQNGAIFYFDKWNIGDPSRTTTAVGRWYSFHGKFIVTDKTAIALSANLTQGQEIDALISFNDEDRIREFNRQFDRLIELFVRETDSIDGSIKQEINNVNQGQSSAIFELPRNIGQEHRNHWIRQYPLELCLSDEDIIEKLYLVPFDYTGRQLIMNIIKEAERFVYISTETFTDQNFSEFLVAIAINKKIDIKVLTGGTSMDFTDRMENMLRELLAHKIQVSLTNKELHAKLLVTDKAVVVSSINLNKMNLGFFTSKGYWRENTETAFVCLNKEVIEKASERFIAILNEGQSIENKLLVKLQTTVRRNFARIFGLNSSTDARKLIAKFILLKQLENKRVLTKIGMITNKLMEHYKRTKIERQDFISAVILYYLSERKQDYSCLNEKIVELDESVNVMAAINQLEFSGFVEKEGDYYKIKIEALFS